ncbi:GldM family protein [Hanstruepera marina]|uniref:GldM family protein n=1 Tax=Hanstruepera marina TaxID=2873265 RepID=UPI0021032012|nr:GldM family protein [Hanstruepera marina]
MKFLYCFLFLLINIIGFSQEPHKAVVEVNKMNVVYRGVSNPLTLSMPGTVSFEASAPGLKKVDDYGNYIMHPGSGLTVDIELRGKLPDGEIVTAIKTLRIKDIEKHVVTLNNKSGILELRKNEIINGTIGIKVPNFLHGWIYHIEEFQIKLPNQDPITIKGNVISESINKRIEELKANDIIYIYGYGIGYKVENAPSVGMQYPLQIKIIIKD